MIRNFLLVGLGGALGSMLRYGAGLLIGPRDFPLATFLINVTGSFLIGLVVVSSLTNQQVNEHWKLFLATGLCGGFTTFSAFSLENLQLLQQGKWSLFLLYSIGSVLLGLASAWVAFRILSTS
jgi:CrcB protein